jgi:hypothetical protein
VEPANQQVAVRRFDDAGTVIMPGFEREKEFGPDEWALASGSGVQGKRPEHRRKTDRRQKSVEVHQRLLPHLG